MRRYYAFLIISIIALFCFLQTKDSENLKVLKTKYLEFLKVLPEKYKVLQNRSIITGLAPRWGELGFNVNKGYEISICMDDNTNAMFHILLHELAHGTVPQYEHDTQFWSNFQELKEIAIQHGMYTPIPDPVGFCGKKIHD
tara:strand:- start:569 stop:991 length:423 start_codon:yes stop_codon:yes gene_type:complete